MLVEARINDSAPVVLAVDTGPSHTVLDPKFAKELGLRVQEASPTTVPGNGLVAKSHGPPVTMHLVSVAVGRPEPWVIDLMHPPILAALPHCLTISIRIPQQATL